MEPTKKQIQDYLQNNVNPIFELLLLDLIKSKPRNILNFSKSWFEKKIECQADTQRILLSDSETDSQEEFLEQSTIEDKKAKPRWYKQRKAICGQVYGVHNRIDQSQIPNIVKKTSVNNRILFRLKSLFLFKDFDDQDTSKLISAMTQETYQQDKVIIRQGDQGNQIYIVDEGELHCYRRADGQEIYIKTIMQGQMFGEISMLYNTKRTANIRVKTKATCFKLDRKTFNTVEEQIVMQIMKKIDIFRELEIEQKFKIQDIIQQMPVHLNQQIIRQGKVNNKLFFVEHGKLVALKKQKNGHQKITSNYNDSDYFGLQSLINRQPSPSSVMALTTSKLYFIEIQQMERVIGPIYKILHRNVEVYEKYKGAERVKIIRFGNFYE